MSCVLDATALTGKNINDALCVASDVVFDGEDRRGDMTFDGRLRKSMEFTDHAACRATGVCSFQVRGRGARCWGFSAHNEVAQVRSAFEGH